MGLIIGIFSAKGGVGKTLLATNLAAAFALGHRIQTALIDLHPGNGTADLLLDLKPERSWLDLLDVINELTSHHLHLAVTPYRPGLDLLASPARIVWEPPLSQNDLASLLDTFQAEYDLVVVDVPAGMSPLAGGTLALVDLRLITLTPDAPAMRATGRYLEHLPGSHLSTGLVINQFARGAAVSPSEIKDHFNRSIMGVLPIDPSGVWTNISYGEPCVLRRSSKLGRAIRELSSQLVQMLNSNGLKD